MGVSANFENQHEADKQTETGRPEAPSLDEVEQEVVVDENARRIWHLGTDAIVNHHRRAPSVV